MACEVTHVRKAGGCQRLLSKLCSLAAVAVHHDLFRARVADLVESRRQLVVRNVDGIRDVATGQVVNDDADSRVDKPGPGQVYEGSPMPNFLRFDGGVGMHTGFLPGYPASHGCVRMPNHMAEKFFEHATVGTPVLVE